MRIEFEEYRLKLEGMRAELEDLASALGLSKLQSEVEQLEKQAAQEGFWDDLANSQKVLQKTKQAKHKIENISRFTQSGRTPARWCSLPLRRGTTICSTRSSPSTTRWRSSSRTCACQRC